MILCESIDLVIDGADFYRSIEKASMAKLRNGWCDFTRLVLLCYKLSDTTEGAAG
jgi:hypothetical protein